MLGLQVVLGKHPLRQLIVRTEAGAGAGINTKDSSVSILQRLIAAPHQQELYLAAGLVYACWVRTARPDSSRDSGARPPGCEDVFKADTFTYFYILEGFFGMEDGFSTLTRG